jgi:hypothetical protein
MLLTRRVSFVCGAAMIAAGLASAQSLPSPTFSTVPADESSSSSLQLVPDNGLDGAAALHDAAAALGSGSGQYGKDKAGTFSVNHIGFEAGTGFNAPIGNDTSTGGGGPFITWGGNFTVGAGLNFNKRFSLLGEFQFIDDKLPGSLIAEAGNGATLGNAHIISLTADPVIDLLPKHVNSVYVTGGFGYYHKSTNFNAEECCDFYGYPVEVTANSFSSDQLGLNFGLGYSHRLGGVYGDGRMKLFAEARYTYIHTPPITQTNGLGTTELIPVNFGVRF